MIRALIACALLSAGCAKGYEELIAAGEEVNCPAEALCPGAEVCVTYENEGRCKANLACSVLQQDCNAKYASRADYGQRKRCALMQTGDGIAGGQCTQQYGESPEGSQCDVHFLVDDGFGYFTGGTLGPHFPNEDVMCAAGLICHNLPMLNSAQAGPGTCQRFCKADGDCGSRRCIDAFGPAVTTTNISLTDGKLGVCLPSCTLFGSPSGCEAQQGTVCQPVMAVGSTLVAFGICRKPGGPSGGTDEGRLCAEGTPCPSGYGCLPDGNSMTCRKLCKTGTVGCAAGQACNTTDFQISNGVGICK